MTENSGVDPRVVPYKTIRSTGAPIPAVGLGTFGSDKYGPQEVADAVKDAISLGYRHIDCAAVYGNEAEIGQALAEAIKSGVAREELWVTSKLWNDSHHPDDVVPAFKKSLSDLGVGYLDLYLIHWPFPNHHAKGVSVESRDTSAKPFNLDAYMKIWEKLEGLVSAGLVRHIGASNMSISKLQGVMERAHIAPAVHEMEIHPHFQQEELFRFCIQKDILPIGYSPLGSPSRPERDKTPDDTVDMEDPVIVDIARKAGATPAQICVKWAIQRGQVPIPFSVKRTQYLASLQAAALPDLSPEEMDAIRKTDRNCRLIKGQVFLWPGETDWRALWT